MIIDNSDVLENQNIYWGKSFVLYALPYSCSFCSMKWVELKMGQLGVLDNPNYKITAMLDHMAMITVQSDHYGVFNCKPLGLIWAHFPEVGFFYLVASFINEFMAHRDD